jgi:DNA-binding MarR family transcriptional regulator
MPRKTKPNYATQPSVAAILKLISRARGATAAEIAKARDLEPHTVRATISRLGTKARIRITRGRDPKRGTVYKAAR